jgi:hypothetical protein
MNNWWANITQEEQTKYLIDHPASKKVENTVTKIISSMDKNELEKYSVAINEVSKDPLSHLKPHRKNILKELVKNKDKLIKLAKMKDSPILRKALFGVVGTVLLAAGASYLGIPINDPILAISLINLVKRNMHLVAGALLLHRNSRDFIKDFFGGVMDGIKEGLEDHNKLKQSLIPAGAKS